MATLPGERFNACSLGVKCVALGYSLTLSMMINLKIMTRVCRRGFVRAADVCRRGFDDFRITPLTEQTLGLWKRYCHGFTLLSPFRYCHRFAIVT
jgi:hypothetical protein